MRKINSIFFLLFLLIITGCFAAFAKNSYGITILVWATSAYSLTSLVGALIAFTGRKKNSMMALEFMVIATMFAVVTLRILFVRFPYVELLFSGLSLALAAIYIYHLLRLPKLGKGVIMSLSSIYGGVIIFALAATVSIYSSLITDILGITACFFVLIGFIISRRVNSIVYQEKEINYFSFLAVQPNQAVLLISLFLLISVYSFAFKFDLVQEIHSSKMPEGYYKLVASEAKDEESGELKYEIYKDKLDNFIRNRKLNN